MKIVIYSGTTEGRLLSHRLAELGLKITVCVATGYGREEQGTAPNNTVQCGYQTVAEMCDTVSVVYGGRVVEHGTLRDVFKNTRHPYTEGLFNSLPDMENPKAELKPIPGLMPDPTIQPKGCPFAPRCKYANAKCSEEKPPRLYVNEEHYVECHLYDEQSVVTGGKIER